MSIYISFVEENGELVDPRLGVDELAVLNQEVTSDVEALLNQMLIRKAMSEVSSTLRVEVVVDWEKVLNQVVDVQERMAKGMVLINQCTKVIEDARGGKRLVYDVYVAWCERRKALWTHWFKLKVECDDLVGDNDWLWGRYFNLKDEEINPYNTSGDTEDVDDYSLLANTQVEVMDEYFDSHVKEESRYLDVEAGGNGFWSWRNQKSVERGDNKRLEMNNLLEYVDQY